MQEEWRELLEEGGLSAADQLEGQQAGQEHNTDLCSYSPDIPQVCVYVCVCPTVAMAGSSLSQWAAKAPVCI
jgi:acetyl-CoA carboxylase carboxyltransferase component